MRKRPALKKAVRKDDVHQSLKPFIGHRVVFTGETSGDADHKQSYGTCPFCSKPSKFYVAHSTQLWDCKVCNRNGNLQQFLMQRSKFNKQCMRGIPLTKLAEDRGLKSETLLRWNVGWDLYQYTIPVPTLSMDDDLLSDLKRYRLGSSGSGNLMRITPGTEIGLVRYKQFDESVDTIFVCEGEWDAMALDELLIDLGMDGVAVCTGSGGAGTFKSEWSALFRGKDVVLVYDNDEAGRSGLRKAYGFVSPYASSVSFVIWNDDYPDKFDFRDLYKKHKKDAYRILSSMISEDTDDLFEFDPTERTSNGKIKPKKKIETIEFRSGKRRKKLIGPGLPWYAIENAYKEWLLLSSTDVLKIVYGVMFANRLPGDPLWLFLVAPPGGTKSEILMSFYNAPLTYSTTSLTPHTLISGAIAKGGIDPSLLPVLDGKVLIIKDFTAILSMPESQQTEILGILRDAFDGQASKTFGTGMHRSYESVFGIVAGVTPIIDQRQNEHSALGERFLKYRIPVGHGTSHSGGDIILRALSNITREGSMRDRLQEMAKTALSREISMHDVPTLTPVQMRRLSSLAQLVAVLRGSVAHERYTQVVLGRPTVEVGTRLAKQLAKLAMGIAIAMFEDYVSDEVMRLVTQVGFDTIPDRIFDVVRSMYTHTKAERRNKKRIKGKPSKIDTEESATTAQISEWTHLPIDTISRLMDDLLLLRVVKRPAKEPGASMVTGSRWVLNSRLRAIITSLEVW